MVHLTMPANIPETFVSPGERGKVVAPAGPGSSKKWLPIATQYKTSPTPDEFVSDMIHQAMAQSVQFQEPGGLRSLTYSKGSLQQSFAAWLPPSVARQKLEGFFAHWRMEVVHADERAYTCRLLLHRTLWQRLIARQPFIEIQIRLDIPVVALARLTEITVDLTYHSGEADDGKEVLELLGTNLLDSLHACLSAAPEQRIHNRFPFEHSLDVAPLYPSDQARSAVPCVSRNVSLSGISFYMPCKPTAAEIAISFGISLATRKIGVVKVPALIDRIPLMDNGRYLVAAEFLLDRTPLPSAILLIEGDSSYAREITGMMLGKRGTSFDLECINNLARGLDRLGAGGIDLLLLDICSPNSGGLQALAQAHRIAPEVPIVALAHGVDGMMALKAAEMGAENCLEKSTMDASLLVRTLHCTIERSRAAACDYKPGRFLAGNHQYSVQKP